jgi:hypothetical protein
MMSSFPGLPLPGVTRIITFHHRSTCRQRVAHRLRAIAAYRVTFLHRRLLCVTCGAPPTRHKIMASQPTQIFANYLEVGQNAAEFVLAFGVYNEGDAAPQIQIRIHSTPAHAAAFAKVLEDALAHHARLSGAVQED